MRWHKPHRIPHHVLRFFGQLVRQPPFDLRFSERWKNLRYLKKYLMGRVRPDLEEDRPWLNYELVSFLERQPRGWVLEFGAGRSTLWLARQGFQVLSIEHQPEWFEKVSAWLFQNDLQSRVELSLAEVDPLNPQNAEAYLRPLRQSQAYSTLRLILVDGIFRDRCLDECASFLDRDVAVVLHDSDRPAFQNAMQTLAKRAGVEARTIFGPGYGTPDFTQATIFLPRNKR